MKLFDSWYERKVPILSLYSKRLDVHELNVICELNAHVEIQVRNSCNFFACIFSQGQRRIVDRDLCMHAYRGHTDGLLCLAKGDSLLYSGGYDHTVKIWDAKVRELLILCSF
jgi:WD40 repeat protein